MEVVDKGSIPVALKLRGRGNEEWIGSVIAWTRGCSPDRQRLGAEWGAPSPGLNRLRKNSESHTSPYLLDGCPMFALAYMG